MHRKVLAIAFLWLIAPATAFAQQPPGNDPVAEALFPPELVMTHQQDLGLSDSQRTAIQSEIQTAQKHFTQVQWQLAGAVEALAALLKQPRVDQSQVLTQLDKVLGFEREVKRIQLTLMIGIKNALSQQQQERLRHIREMLTPRP